MKKYLYYILIIVALVGIFGPTVKTKADTYEPLGICNLPSGTKMHWTENTCYDNDPAGTDWNEDTGTCNLGNLSYNSCVNDHKASSSLPSTINDKDKTYGACVGYTWSDTLCHQNSGTFNPVFNGTTPLAGTAPVGICSVTHVSSNGCAKVGGKIDSSLVDNVATLGSGGGTCTVSTTQDKCNTYGGGFWNTISGSWGGVPVATWFPPGVTPGTVAPMDTSNYTLLAPLPNGSGGQFTTFNSSDSSALGNYLNLIIKIFIGFCAVLAMVMIVMGGIEYMTSELPGNKEAGKERITEAVFGLVLALLAWTLLNTINPSILNTDLSSMQSVAADVDANSDVPQTPINGKYTNGGIQGGPWNDQTAGSIAILPQGVSVYNSQCSTIGQTGCTSTRGLSLSYINTILSNCSSCVPLSIQGGTEYWLHGGHSGSTSHGPNSPTVDLGVNQNLTNWIMTGNPNTAPTTSPVYFTRHQQGGISFLYESNHWHAGN